MKRFCFIFVFLFLSAVISAFAVTADELSPDARALLPKEKMVIVTLKDGSEIKGKLVQATSLKVTVKVLKSGDLWMTKYIENADMAGLDLTLSIHDYILKHLESSPNPSPLLKEKVAKGELGFKTGKGFQTWTAEEIKKSREGLVDYLIEWTKREQSKNKE